MIVSLIGVAIAFAAGVWLFIATVWPAPPPLADAIERLHSTRPGIPSRLPSTAPTDSILIGWGRRVLDRVNGNGFIDDQVVRDLEVVRRPVEMYAGTCAVAALAGALVGPTIWLAVALVGTRLPFFVPLWLSATGAISGAIVPRFVLRAEAKQARSDFRHALGAYLDVLVLLLAANHGPEGAMREAALAGSGPAFMELRRATTQAQYSGAVWDALDRLGERIGVVELQEIAAAGSLAGERGAAVRKSLIAKARSLRSSSLSEAESTARQRSQAMFGPILLMGLGFIVFLMFPLLSNLDIG
jgi:tight adherence protein C